MNALHVYLIAAASLPFAHLIAADKPEEIPKTDDRLRAAEAQIAVLNKRVTELEKGMRELIAKDGELLKIISQLRAGQIPTPKLIKQESPVH